LGPVDTFQRYRKPSQLHLGRLRWPSRCGRLGLVVQVGPGMCSTYWVGLGRPSAAGSPPIERKIWALLQVQCLQNTQVRIQYCQMTPMIDVLRCRDTLSSNVKVPGWSPYLHVCDVNFSVDNTRWYSLIRNPKFMTLKDCGERKDAAAWRVGKHLCFVFFHWNGNTGVEPHPRTGSCYILDKVVPLGSHNPPQHIVTMNGWIPGDA
jgi:hypothetical protein